jgi:hypothetical protein
VTGDATKIRGDILHSYPSCSLLKRFQLLIGLSDFIELTAVMIRTTSGIAFCKNIVRCVPEGCHAAAADRTVKVQ